MAPASPSCASAKRSRAPARRVFARHQGRPARPRRTRGRIATRSRRKGGLFRHGLPNRIVYDYTEDGTLRSIDASLKRLRTDRLDTVWIHDPAVDFHGDAWRDVFDVAMSGAARARLRDEGDPGLGPRREPRRAVRTRARTRGPRRFPARRTLHAARPCRRARTADAGKRRARSGSSSAARTTRACWRAARITSISRPRRPCSTASRASAGSANDSASMSARWRCNSRSRTRPSRPRSRREPARSHRRQPASRGDVDPGRTGMC